MADSAPLSPDSRPLPSGGNARPITRWGTEVMHRPQKLVTAYDDSLRALAADMVATMEAADGVGLAACQIGEDVAMFVFDCPDDEGIRYTGVVCNPVLVALGEEERALDYDDEGCLSFPGAFVPLARPERARVEGFDVDGEPVVFEGTGLFARCLQHETDHTLGTVFGDRLSDRARKKLTKAHEKVASDYSLTWPADDPGAESV